MVAYGVPVIHQSLATAPLDIKEAIDWLIRIGGKDVKDKGKERTEELISVVKDVFQYECQGDVSTTMLSDIKSTELSKLIDRLANFIGYFSDGKGDGLQRINGSGVGRRSGESIAGELEKYLSCCKNDRTSCDTDNCRCCQDDSLGAGVPKRCSSYSCPIRSLLECPIILTVSCEGGTKFEDGRIHGTNLCCLLDMIVCCFKENEVLDNNSVKCRRCGSKLHQDCHRGCKCKHRKLTSRVACRINCLIQLAVTVNSLYTNKDVTICQICRYCTVCNPPNQKYRCQPCLACRSALKGRAQHCANCRKGECCEENKSKNKECQTKCSRCRRCSLVRAATVFWRNHHVLLKCCAKCAECIDSGIATHSRDCEVCKACQGDSCVEGCRNRRKFGRLVAEVFHFMLYNFRNAAYVSKKSIKAIKDECCIIGAPGKSCNCKDTCCKDCNYERAKCSDCHAHCICCADGLGTCICSNKCSQKLELVMRPAVSGYFSAYDHKMATWENLCSNHGQYCSRECTAECSCVNSGCPLKGCCAHCPKRLCAKIFCHVLPTVNNFMRYLENILTEKGIERQISDSVHTPTAKQYGNLINGDAYLGRFLRSCGFNTRRLLSKRGCELVKNDGFHKSCKLKEHKPGNVNDILDTCKELTRRIKLALKELNIHAEKSSLYRVKPRTVYEKLLWLCGLPFCEAYGRTRRSFKHVTAVGNAGNNFLGLSVRSAVYVFHIFEDSSDSVWEYITQGFMVPGRSHYLYYNPDPMRLLWDIYDVVYAVTCAMVFLNKQCSVSNRSCGWEACIYGRNVLTKTAEGNICKCPSTCKATCLHCSGVCQACRPGARCVCCCQHCEHSPPDCICLMNFVITDGRAASDSDQSIRTAFYNAIYGYIGQPKDRLRVDVFTGAALLDRMSGLFCRDYAIFSRLLEYLLRARAGMPENVSDYYSMFLNLGIKLESEARYAGSHKSLTKSFKSTILDTYFGADETVIELVVSAVHGLYNQDHRVARGAAKTHNTDNHTAYDMMSLYGCPFVSGCVGYMDTLCSTTYALLLENPYRPINETAMMYVSWIFGKATAFIMTMRHFAMTMKTLECCSVAGPCTCNPSESNSCKCDDSKQRCYCVCELLTVGSLRCPCATAVKCRNILPFLYRHGFTFSVPHTVSSNGKKCKDFSETLDRFVAKNSMLCKVLESIETFLWAVRRPFCIALLVAWVALFCFLSYVLMYKLDKFHVQPYVFIKRQVHSRTNRSDMDGLYI